MHCQKYTQRTNSSCKDPEHFCCPCFSIDLFSADLKRHSRISLAVKIGVVDGVLFIHPIVELTDLKVKSDREACVNIYRYVISPKWCATSCKSVNKFSSNIMSCSKDKLT